MSVENLKVVNIFARDIPDAWFQCVDAVTEHGFTYEIQHGSFIGDKRLELDFVTIHITHPQTRPMEPDIPPQYGIPNPVEPGYIEQYAPYLMEKTKEPGEDYTYGERMKAGNILPTHSFNVDLEGKENPYREKYYRDMGILEEVDQIEHFIKVLHDTPHTNQAILQVGQPSDSLLGDPPCLRHIDMRIRRGKLVFYPYFRSWDLWGGLPANLGGIVYLQEYMAGEIGVEPGEIIASSKGLHIYRYVWELATTRTGKSREELAKKWDQNPV